MIFSNSTKDRLTVFLCLLFILTGLTYYHRNPTNDDAWFGEQSYWFYKEGIIRSEFFTGILGWEKQLLVSHKLFLIFGSGLIKLFGFNLPVLQFVGLIFFYVMIGGILTYIRKTEAEYSSWYMLMILILIYSNRLLIKMSFENRPEIMLASLGLLSFLFIYFAKNQHWKIALAAVLAGLAALAHLNGVIYLIAGFLTLVFLKRYRQAVIFWVFGVMTASAYFIDVLQAEDGLSVWYYQFRNDPATQNAFGLWPKLFVMLTYLKVFFIPLENLALSLLFVFILWRQRNYILDLPANLRIYTMCLFISFWLINKRNTAYYMILFIPFMLLIIYELYRLKPFIDNKLKGVLIIYFVIGIYGMGQIIHKNLSLEYLPQAYTKLRGHIPVNELGLVPITFFFNEYEHYPNLLNHENYGYYDSRSSDPVTRIADWAHKKNVGFILLDYKYRPEYFHPKPNTKKIPFYKLSFFDGRFAVYTKD